MLHANDLSLLNDHMCHENCKYIMRMKLLIMQHFISEIHFSFISDKYNTYSDNYINGTPAFA